MDILSQWNASRIHGSDTYQVWLPSTSIAIWEGYSRNNLSQWNASRMHGSDTYQVWLPSASIAIWDGYSQWVGKCKESDTWTWYLPNVTASIARGIQAVHGRLEKVKSPQTEAVNNSPNLIVQRNGKMSDHAHIHSSVKINIKLPLTE